MDHSYHQSFFLCLLSSSSSSRTASRRDPELNKFHSLQRPRNLVILSRGSAGRAKDPPNRWINYGPGPFVPCNWYVKIGSYHWGEMRLSCVFFFSLFFFFFPSFFSFYILYVVIKEDPWRRRSSFCTVRLGNIQVLGEEIRALRSSQVRAKIWGGRETSFSRLSSFSLRSFSSLSFLS